MRHLLLTLIAVALLAVPALAQDDTPEPFLPPLDALDDGWNTLVPGGATTCGRGTPYQFFVRRTDNTDRLMIYFQGGGACWNFFTCRPGGTFDDSVGSLEDEIGMYDGVFNYDNSENPLLDYNVVFIPYCTADIHIGESVTTYGDVSISHLGAVNTRAVFEWTFANFTAPETILITGSSAGAYGAIYYTAEVIDAYPDTRVVQFGDGGVGASPVGWVALRDWDIYANMYPFDPPIDDPDTFTINKLYGAHAQAFPDTIFSQFTHANDEVQVFFYTFSSLPGAPPWQEVMRANLDGLAAFDNFVAFVSGGDEHTILATPDFYRLSVGGVRFLDWFTALINGEPVASVQCEGNACEAVERIDD